MLTEDDVVNAVCSYLERSGWTIVSRALAHQRGDDIVARRGVEQLLVEAKGGGSSKASSARFGKEFTLGQCQVNVGMALLRGLRVASAGSGHQAAVAFPDTPNYRRVVQPILNELGKTSVVIYMVQEDRAVSVVT